MKVAPLFLFLFSLLLWIPHDAYPFELEGFAGFYRFDESLAREFKADNTPLYGLRFGSGARHIISGETTIGYGLADDIRILLLMGNFLLNIPVDMVVPFLTIGTGTTIYLPKDVATKKELVLDTETKFTLNYGGGLRYFLNDLLALRLDIRDYVTFDLDFDVSEAATGGTSGVTVGTIHNTVFSGGLSLVF